MRLVLISALAACGGSSPSGPMITVLAEAGDQPEPGATVISHDATGAQIDEVMADGTGTAMITTGPFITVVFPGDLQPTTANISFVTTVPPASGQLVVHGPLHEPPEEIVGALTVMPMTPLAADSYDVEIGCATIHVTAMPAIVQVGAKCLGSDTNLDVLVLAYASGQVIGYTAGRVEFDSGSGVLAPATWDTTGTPVPITLTGVQPALDWELFVDGLPFDAQALVDQGQLWNGLAVDSATVHATLGGPTATQATTLEISTPPTAIAFGASDFLAAVTPSLVLADPVKLAVTWTAASVTDADAVDLHLAWSSDTANITWDAVLPPDAAAITFPALDSTLMPLALPPSATPMAQLSYVDVPSVTGFAALGEVYVEGAPATIGAPPADGEIRYTSMVGF